MCFACVLVRPDANVYYMPASHSFTLDAALRARGLAHLGHDTSLIAKLDRGEPITVAILGASVAINSGCLMQPSHRCMRNNGRQPVAMLWGEPRVRPFKGFLVRWFEYLNATWPHPQHRIINAGKDATSMETIVPCLFSHLPPSFDLLLIEGGSMFLGNTPGLMEAMARQVLEMRSRPTIAFITAHYWCTHGGDPRKRVMSSGWTALPVRRYRFYANRSPVAAVRAREGGFAAYINASATSGAAAAAATDGSFVPRKVNGSWVNGNQRAAGFFKMGATTFAYRPPSWAALTDAEDDGIAETNPSDTLEDGISSLCREAYPDVSCISQRDALSQAFVEARDGFSIEQIAADCLHPVHGSLGTEYMTDLLVEWTMALRKAHHSNQERQSAPDATTTTHVPPRQRQQRQHYQQQQRHHAADSSEPPHRLLARSTDTSEQPPPPRLLPPPPRLLPPPLYPMEWQRFSSHRAACYHLHASGLEVLALDELAWSTCHTAPGAMGAVHSSECTPTHSAHKCPRSYTPPSDATSDHTHAVKPQARGLPTVWVVCPFSLNGQMSPGVAAFMPGATLHIPLPTDWLGDGTSNSDGHDGLSSASGTSDIGHETASLAAFNATLQYTISYRLMGRVGITCAGRCSCASHQLDAHATFRERNMTVYSEHTLTIQLLPRSSSTPTGTGAPERASNGTCTLTLAVLPGSSSGGHYFKVRDVVLYEHASPCQGHEVLDKGRRDLINRRNHLHCGVNKA